MTTKGLLSESSQSLFCDLNKSAKLVMLCKKLKQIEKVANVDGYEEYVD